METSHNLPNAEYRRFEGMREYEELIDRMIPQTLRTIRIFDRALGRSYNTPERFELLHPDVGRGLSEKLRQNGPGLRGKATNVLRRQAIAVHRPPHPRLDFLRRGARHWRNLRPCRRAR